MKHNGEFHTTWSGERNISQKCELHRFKHGVLNGSFAVPPERVVERRNRAVSFLAALVGSMAVPDLSKLVPECPKSLSKPPRPTSFIGALEEGSLRGRL